MERICDGVEDAVEELHEGHAHDVRRVAVARLAEAETEIKMNVCIVHSKATQRNKLQKDLEAKCNLLENSRDRAQLTSSELHEFGCHEKHASTLYV